VRCLIICLLLVILGVEVADAAVYDVPADIPADCSVAVDDEITAWLASVPDGNTARFAAGGCYGQDGTIGVNGRTDLVIDGQGSDFRTLTPGDEERASWRFVGGTNLTVRNVDVRGANPGGVYSPGFEWQHGFAVEGVQGMTLTNVSARETWGDGVFLWHGAGSPACGDDASSARNVAIAGATLERIGRQGVAVVDAENVTVRDSLIGPVALANVDLETDDDCELARHITITRNQFGAHTWGVVDSVGFGADPQVGDVTVTDNTETAAAPGCFAPVRILSPVVPDGQPRVYRSGYTFSGNRLRGTRNGFEFRGLRDVEVSSNDVALPPTTGCGKRAGVLLVDSHDVGITSNTFAGANNVFKTDMLSTGITATGNSTADTSISSGPEGSVNAATADFGFEAEGVASGFECRLDAAAFELCSSPSVYAELADGPHTFEVRALDASSAPDPTPASRSWTVDTLAPSVTLDQPAAGSTTDDTTPGFAGTAGSQPGDSQTVTVRIWPGSDASGSPLQTRATSRDPVTGAYAVSADTLPNGTYTARAEQSDAADNSGQSDPVTFTIDSSPPAAPRSDPVLTPVTPLLQPPPDVTSPTLRLGGRRTQRARKSVRMTVTAVGEDLWASASGRLALEGSARRYGLRGFRGRFIARGQTATLELRLPPDALSAARRALRSLREVRAGVRLSARDAAGNVATRKRSIKLER
jgi:Bacterial Ig-like domain